MGSVLATNDELRHLVVSIQPSIDGLPYLIFSSMSVGLDANRHPMRDAGLYRRANVFELDGLHIYGW